MDVERANELINEASSYIGMISEVKSKCLLFKSRLEKARRDGDSPEGYEEEFERETSQMKRDLATYSRKLELIYEELREHGFISNVA